MFPEVPRSELTKRSLLDRLLAGSKACAPVVEWIAYATA